MIRRRSTRDETPDCDSIQMGELYRRQINGMTTGIRSRNRQNIPTDPQCILERPVFNIHIHVPPYRGGNFQMYLPRLHPIVHLHFDEIARKLEIRRGQNEETTYRLFKSLLAMTSPTYGDVKFYTSHTSEEHGFKEFEVPATATTTTTTTTSSENMPTGGGPLVNGTTEYSKNRVRKRTSCCGESSSYSNNHQRKKMDNNQKNKSPRKRSKRNLEKEFKLKKAVVVLTDICKSKYYKNLLKTSAGVSNEQRIEDSHDGLDRTESEQYNSEPCAKRFIKTEAESPEPESPLQVHEEYETHCASSIISPSNEVGIVKTEKDENYDLAKSLTSLVEGCNFSEILHRFRVKKCEEHLVDSVKNLNDSTVENFVNNSELSYNCETSEQDSYHENKFMINETWAEDNVPGVTKSELTVEEGFDWKINNIESKEISTFEDIVLPSGSQNAETIPQSDFGDGLLVDDPKPDDDENEVPKMVSNQKIIRATSNSEIEILSCGTSPFLVPVNRFQFLKTEENNSDCNWSINLQLELIKEEMARRNMNNSNSSSKKSGKGVKKKSLKSSSEGKKSKESGQQASNNSSQAVDYIPLQASGPTRFAVAPLNKVNPYKSHDARNFRKEMLCGNRVNRFQNADHLRIYKMKKDAGRRTSS